MRVCSGLVVEYVPHNDCGLYTIQYPDNDYSFALALLVTSKLTDLILRRAYEAAEFMRR